jgi:beta-galactosidase
MNGKRFTTLSDPINVFPISSDLNTPQKDMSNRYIVPTMSVTASFFKSLMVLALIAFSSALAMAGSANDVVIWNYLKTGMATSVTQGWRDTRTDASISGQPLSIAGKHFEKGLGTHAPGQMVFPLGGNHHAFSADVGVDDQGGATGSVVFKVLLDGREAFDSGLMKFGQSAKHVSLDLNGVSELRLVVTDGGDGVQGDHADWANAAIDDAVSAKPVPYFSAAGFFAITNSPRAVMNFNPGWRFLKGDVAGGEKPEFDDSNWEAANLPASLEILGENESGGRNYQGPAWYRKRFSVARTSPDGKVFIYFEAVMGKCQVWVNGHKIAEHFGGYLPFAAEISALLNSDGKDNIIAVRADNSNDPTYPPGKPQNDLDFTYLGGIYGDVYLIQSEPVHVTLPELSQTPAGGGVFIGVKDVDGNDASLEVRTEIANDSSTSCDVILRTILETPDGVEIIRGEISTNLAAGTAREMTQALEPKNVHLWSPNDPYLHFVRTEVLINGKICDSLRTRVGIRLFEMRGDDGLFVNKKYVGMKLNGVNRHQDYPYIGNALPNSGQWRDVKLLREGGVNMIRAAHYPQDPAFYDACDELGMLVTTANPGWQFFNNNDPIFEQRIYADTRNLVRRDRNHPSMLLWETALNETPNQPAGMLHEMHRIAHEEYPFPGLYTVADVDEGRKGGLDFYYYGPMSGPINNMVREYGDGGEVDNFFSHNASTRVKREWGEGPLLEQAGIRAHALDGVFGGPRIRLGAALWCGIDHQRGYHPDPFWGGLLDEFRVPRYAYYLFKSQYDSDFKLPGITTGPMVYITHELTQVSGPNVVVYGNCEEVRLTWLGKVVGTQKPDQDYHSTPHPPFTFTNVFDFAEIKSHWRDRTGKIEMVAEGLIGGKVVTREVKKYPERTTGVQVFIDDANIGLTADGSDFVPVRATIVDNKGVPKVLASEYVYFQVDGPGEIIGGVDNQANPKKTEFGTATALLRATTTPGVIHVKAYVKGLQSGEAYIASNPAPLPLDYDAQYVAASKLSSSGQTFTIIADDKNSSADLKKMKAEVDRLTQELTSKEQDLMDLRGKVGK